MVSSANGRLPRKQSEVSVKTAQFPSPPENSFAGSPLHHLITIIKNEAVICYSFGVSQLENRVRGNMNLGRWCKAFDKWNLKKSESHIREKKEEKTH